jgi:nucleotide-binding universal stress UspA family protein
MFAPKRILVPVDFSEPSTRALMHAIAMAEQFGASLDVLHVVPNPYIRPACICHCPSRT